MYGLWGHMSQKVQVLEAQKPLKLKKSTGIQGRNLLKGQNFTNKVNFLPNNPKNFIKRQLLPMPHFHNKISVLGR